MVVSSGYLTGNKLRMQLQRSFLKRLLEAMLAETEVEY